jgi:hypothetical protein
VFVKVLCKGIVISKVMNRLYNNLFVSFLLSYIEREEEDCYIIGGRLYNQLCKVSLFCLWFVDGIINHFQEV